MRLDEALRDMLEMQPIEETRLENSSTTLTFVVRNVDATLQTIEQLGLPVLWRP